jgi:osmotically-inducible protein OsmY
MNTRETVTRRALQIAVASVFVALNLAACDQKPSAEKVGKDIDRAVDKAGQQVEQAASAAEKKFEQAKDAAGKTMTETGKAIDDASVTAKVKSALIAEPGLKALAIEVDTSGGVVTLHGTANTPESRAKATQVASNVEGVKSVKNNLIIVKGT